MESEHPFWSYPSYENAVAADFLKAKFMKTDRRKEGRLRTTVPATIVTTRGASIPARTRDVSRRGMGLVLHGLIGIGEEITIKLTSDTREYKYSAIVRYCNHFRENVFLVGAEFSFEDHD